MKPVRSHGERKSRTGRAGASRCRPTRDDDTGRRVRVTCPACGVVRVACDDVVLRSCVDDRSWSYRARCSQCGSLFVAFTPASLALPAIAAGIAVEQWTLPTPSARPTGGPLREVDALELHLALMRPDWIDELTGGAPSDGH